MEIVSDVVLLCISFSSRNERQTTGETLFAIALLVVHSWSTLGSCPSSRRKHLCLPEQLFPVSFAELPLTWKAKKVISWTMQKKKGGGVGISPSKCVWKTFCDHIVSVFKA